jgi:hypothetical protein
MGVKLGLRLRKEHRLRVFENRVLRRIFGPKREAVPRGYTVWSFINFTLHKILLGLSNQGE